MSQLGGAKPDATVLHWGDGGTPYTKTPPSEGKKDTGWAFKQLVPYDELNWRWYTEYLFLKWLYDVVPGEFSTLAEAIPLVAVPRTFRVHPPDAGMYVRFAELLNVQGSGGANTVVDVASDGEQIYYAQLTKAYGADPSDGSKIWAYEYNPSNNVDKIASDGLNVYVGPNSAQIKLLDPSDGTLNATAPNGTTGTWADIVANSEWLVSAIGNVAYFHDQVDSTPVLQGSYDHGAAINALAIDDKYAYLGGTQGTGPYDLRQIKLATQAHVWRVLLPTSNTPTINCLVADGDSLFVGTDWESLSGGGNATLWCFNALNGTLRWTYDTTAPVEHITVDDRFLYITDTFDHPHVFDKRNGQWLDYTGQIDLHVYAADGLSMIGTDGANNIMRHSRGGPTRTFMRVRGDDPTRRPFYNLAIPVGEGI